MEEKSENILTFFRYFRLSGNCCQPVDKPIKKYYSTNMKFELTKAQIIALATTDRTFLSNLIDKVMTINELPDINQMAEVFALENQNSPIAAIRALREWAQKNLYALRCYNLVHGVSGSVLGLKDAKELIERAREKHGLKPFWRM